MNSKVVKWFRRQPSIRRLSGSKENQNDAHSKPPEKERKKSSLINMSFRKKFRKQTTLSSSRNQDESVTSSLPSVSISDRPLSSAFVPKETQSNYSLKENLNNDNHIYDNLVLSRGSVSPESSSVGSYALHSEADRSISVMSDRSSLNCPESLEEANSPTKHEQNFFPVTESALEEKSPIESNVKDNRNTLQSENDSKICSTNEFSSFVMKKNEENKVSSHLEAPKALMEDLCNTLNNNANLEIRNIDDDDDDDFVNNSNVKDELESGTAINSTSSHFLTDKKDISQYDCIRDRHDDEEEVECLEDTLNDLLENFGERSHIDELSDSASVKSEDNLKVTSVDTKENEINQSCDNEIKPDSCNSNDNDDNLYSEITENCKQYLIEDDMRTRLKSVATTDQNEEFSEEARDSVPFKETGNEKNYNEEFEISDKSIKATVEFTENEEPREIISDIVDASSSSDSGSLFDSCSDSGSTNSIIDCNTLSKSNNTEETPNEHLVYSIKNNNNSSEMDITISNNEILDDRPLPCKTDLPLTPVICKGIEKDYRTIDKDMYIEKDVLDNSVSLVNDSSHNDSSFDLKSSHYDSDVLSSNSYISSDVFRNENDTVTDVPHDTSNAETKTPNDKSDIPLDKQCENKIDSPVTPFLNNNSHFNTSYDCPNNHSDSDKHVFTDVPHGEIDSGDDILCEEYINNANTEFQKGHPECPVEITITNPSPEKKTKINGISNNYLYPRELNPFGDGESDSDQSENPLINRNKLVNEKEVLKENGLNGNYSNILDSYCNSS